MRIIEALAHELNKPSTNYFIIDAGKHTDDRDFLAYSWQKSRNNMIKEGDLFIYRKSKSLSENKQFYFYGAGKIGPISGKDLVTSQLIKTFQFSSPIFQNSLEDFDWEWKERGSNWEHFWGQYGINKIPKKDFLNLIKIADNNEYDYESSEEIVKSEIEIEKENYFVPDSQAFAKTRPWQAAWSKALKENYGFKCAICGISTTCLLVGSHIIPVSEDKNNRKNPSNGICLCVLHDKAFDKGFITISQENEVIVSDTISNDTILYAQLSNFNKKKLKLPKNHKPKEEFLNYHRINVFKN